MPDVAKASPRFPRAPRPVSRSPRGAEPPGGSFGLPLVELFGIQVFVDWSLFVIFALVSFSLATGLLPRWHPEWPGMLRWSVAVFAAVLFFTSVLLHELSHALVGRAQGIPVRRITLFVFGGVAHLDGEPETPKAELLMAAVGPLTSFVIGIGATVAGFALSGASARIAEQSPEAALAALNPAATLLLWLGPVNIVLAIFNLVPGFPLDGGRILRALLWKLTGDLARATRAAAGVGRAFGFMLVAAGVLMAVGYRVPFFGTGLVSGLWLMLIGWFLQNAARASFERLVVHQRLAGVPVTRVMRSHLHTVAPELSVGDFVTNFVMNTDQTGFPVVQGDSLVGTVSSRDVRAVPQAQWSRVTVGEIMVPVAAALSIEANAVASEALDKLVASDAEQLAVVDHGHLRGVVRRQDILKWLTLQPAT